MHSEANSGPPKSDKPARQEYFLPSHQLNFEHSRLFGKIAEVGITADLGPTLDVDLQSAEWPHGSWKFPDPALGSPYFWIDFAALRRYF